MMFTISTFGLVTFILLLALAFPARSRGWEKEAFVPFLLWIGLESGWFLVQVLLGHQLIEMSGRQAMQFIETVDQISLIVRIAGLLALFAMLVIPRPANWSKPAAPDATRLFGGRAR